MGDLGQHPRTGNPGHCSTTKTEVGKRGNSYRNSVTQKAEWRARLLGTGTFDRMRDISIHSDPQVGSWENKYLDLTIPIPFLFCVGQTQAEARESVLYFPTDQPLGDREGWRRVNLENYNMPYHMVKCIAKIPTKEK